MVGRKRADSDDLRQLPQGLLNEKTPSETADFMQARLAVLLQNDYPQDIVAAVLAKQPRRLDDLTAKLQSRRRVQSNYPKPPRSPLPTNACKTC